MAFTYVVTTDIGKIRFFIRDKTESVAMFEDEELQMLIDLQSDDLTATEKWQRAAVQALDAKITELAAEPDTDADWLSVSYRNLDALQTLRDELAGRWEVPVRPSLTSGGVTFTYRADTLQDSEPDYE